MRGRLARPDSTNCDFCDGAVKISRKQNPAANAEHSPQAHLMQHLQTIPSAVLINHRRARFVRAMHGPNPVLSQFTKLVMHNASRESASCEDVTILKPSA